MSQIASLAEVQAAQAFLKALKVVDWKTNTNLIYAVVAWMRQESGGLASTIGNNPFNLRPGKDIPERLIKGIRTAKNGTHFLIFASLAAGLEAAAIRLLAAGHDWRAYDLIVRAAQNGNAIDFLNAIALSAWNASHYGYVNGDTTTNHLYQVYIRFTGLQMPKPTQPKKTPRALPTARPRDLNVPIVVRNYIDPQVARTFYHARHKASNVLTD